MRNTNLKKAWARLCDARSFVLACHQRPDGDTLGSALALAHVLRMQGKDVVVVSEDGVPENYAFVPESESVVKSTQRRDFEMGLLVDSEGAKRVGGAADAVTGAKTTGCIDHHQPDGEFGDIRVVDPDASSTAEILYELLNANLVEIDEIAATQLLTGLVSDTGAFKFANTTPATFRVAARLTELGARPSAIAREVYDSHPLRAARLLGRALDSLQTDESGRVVWASVRKTDMEELGATDEDTDSIVNHVAAVKGPLAAVLFREIRPDSIRISLRSRDGVDVNQVARVFGGGGHRAAAGCHVAASLTEAEKLVVGEVLKWMES